MFNPFKIFKRRENFTPKERVTSPRVSFNVYCKDMKRSGYAGMNLKKPEGSNKGLINCPVCGKAYSIRLTAQSEVGEILIPGTRHTFTIHKISKTETVRIF